MLRFALLLSVLSLAALASQAQDPGSGGPTPDPQQPTTIPLDGASGLLLAGGVAYGLRRLRRRQLT